MFSGLYSFRMRLAMVIGGLSLVLGLSMMAYVYWTASNRLSEASAAALNGVARGIANVLATTLMEREREIVLLSERPIFVDGDLAAIRAAIDKVQRGYRHYAWIGYADATGLVSAAGGGLLEGERVDSRPWFAEARHGPYVGEVHEAVLLAKKLPASNTAEPLRFVDFAAPVRSREGEVVGVVAAHANWAWVGEVLALALPANAQEQRIEAFVVGHDGAVLHPYAAIGTIAVPADLPSDSEYAILPWKGEGDFLTAQFRLKATTETDLGWRIVVRQSLDTALVKVDDLQHHLLWMAAISTLAFVVIAYRLASEFSRPIEALDRIAKSVRAGDEHSHFQVASRSREVRSLTTSLQEMTSTLVERRQALHEANATLEQKVKVRTAALEAANRELRRLSRHDNLTGMHNRLATTETLRREFLRMRRTQRRYSVLMLDVDHFKRINDTFGHEVGDAVLKQVADILETSTRGTDFIARFGGEEFIAILPDTLEGATELAEKLRMAVHEAQLPLVGQVTISIGIGFANLNDADQDVAVRAADAALYRAKAAGRDRICVASDPAETGSGGPDAPHAQATDPVDP